VSTKINVADWKRQGRAADPICNERMLREENSDIVVAIPGSKRAAGHANSTILLLNF
jgi:hypothetical protein